ncbi:hypothetical protein CBS101457_006902 [Exobasidium rhododendri]|nr:hypothetical protein CBS101457_006902 [Exobasidium rhododendri]
MSSASLRRYSSLPPAQHQYSHDATHGIHRSHSLPDSAKKISQDFHHSRRVSRDSSSDAQVGERFSESSNRSPTSLPNVAAATSKIPMKSFEMVEHTIFPKVSKRTGFTSRTANHSASHPIHETVKRIGKKCKNLLGRP